MYLEISNPMDYHAALYIRLSKEDDSEGPSESVANQQSLLSEFVRRHRLHVYDTYIDGPVIIGLRVCHGRAGKSSPMEAPFSMGVLVDHLPFYFGEHQFLATV